MDKIPPRRFELASTTGLALTSQWHDTGAGTNNSRHQISPPAALVASVGLWFYRKMIGCQTSDGEDIAHFTAPGGYEHVRWKQQPRSSAMTAPDHKIYFTNDNPSRLYTRHCLGRIDIKLNFRRGREHFAVKS